LAGRDWAEQALRGEEPRFVVKLTAKKPAPAWIMNPALIGVHRRIVGELKAAWSARVEGAPMLGTHFVSRTGRFGVAQLAGIRRHHIRGRQRVAAVIEVYAAVADEAGIDTPELSEQTARRWVVEAKTPARVSHRVLGALLRKSPRVIEKMLDEAGRYMRMADKQHRLLDQWGLARVGAESVKSSDSPTASRPGRTRKR
jgi:hypothetical protein